VERGSQRRAEAERRRLLNNLLVAALRRAVTLKEVDDVARIVTEHLHLDVAAGLDVLLNQHGVVAERCRRLTCCGLQRVRECLGVGDDAHALATATRCSLDQNRICISRHVARIELRGHRHASLLGDRARLVLATHRVHDLRRRADEHQACIDHCSGELGTLRQEPVPGVDRLRARFLRGGEQPVDVEV